MNINFNSLYNIEESLNNIINNIKSAYDTEWDDGVHDSFYVYIERVQDCLNNISGLVENLMALQDKCESIDIRALSDVFEIIKNNVSEF